MFELFKFLHVLTVVAAASAAIVPEVVLHAVARTGNVEAIRGVMVIVQRLGMVIGPLFVLAAAFGFIAALTGEFDLLRPWLIASYAVFVVAMIVGAAVSGPWAKRVGVAAAGSPTDSPSAELSAAIHDPRGTISTVILMSSLVTLIFLMVVKPGG